MGLTHFPNGIASFNVPVIGAGGGIPTTTGTYFFVDSATGSSGNTGKTPDAPLATIDQAINKCTANKGDVIVVMPNHAETVAAASGITMDVAGVTICGLGTWAAKPTLTFSATTSTIVVSAANCVISGLKLVSGVNDLANFITLSASGQTVANCDFSSGSATEYFNAISITTTYDNILIDGCTFLQPTDPEGTDAAAGTGAIYLVDSENVIIQNCKFRGQFETACVHNKTTACKGLIIDNCELSNELTVPLLLVATAEGVANRCYGATLTASDATEAQVWGTIGTIFWIHPSSALGNDSGGGGQLAVNGTAAAS